MVMNDMSDSYWAMYTSIKHKERYYRYYSTGSKRINALISGGLIAVTLGGVGSWAIGDYHPFIWICAGIAATAQVVQVLNQFYFPFAKQVAALRYLLPQLSKLILAIDSNWRKLKINTLDNNEISNLIDKYQAQYAELEAQYIVALYMPRRKRSEKKAEIDCRHYFNQHYSTGGNS